MDVKIYPGVDVCPSEICDHRFNAIMTFSHQTDARYLSSIYAAELYGFKNNCRLGAFVNNITGPQNEGISDAEMTGVMRHDIYCPTEYWINPITGALQVIPDWSATNWTAAGAAVFPVTIGATKPYQYPNHGQQMYAASAGAYGYDLVNGISGTNNLRELKGVFSIVQSWLRSVTGRSVSAGSYRLGKNHMAQLMAPYWLGMRDSVPSPSVINVNGNTFYGNSKKGGKLGIPTTLNFSRDTWNSYPSTVRWWDMWRNDGFTKEEATTYVQDQIALTLDNNGWYRDFCHWHAAYNSETIQSIDEYLSILRTAVEGNFIHTCSNGEALEYMYLREMSRKVSASRNGDTIAVVVEVADEFKSSSSKGIPNKVDYQKINTPLTVKIDLSDSFLAGKNITLNWGKPISLTDDQYLIEVPLKSKGEGFMAITIKEGLISQNVDLSVPDGTFSISSGVLSGTCSVPSKIVIFEVASGGLESDSKPFYRSKDFAPTHSITVPAGKDYRVGLISETGQANLISI